MVCPHLDKKNGQRKKVESLYFECSNLMIDIGPFIRLLILHKKSLDVLAEKIDRKTKKSYYAEN